MTFPHSSRTWLVSIALLGIPHLAGADADSKKEGVLSGRVTSVKAPLRSARVYAYRLADLDLSKATTDDQGRFSFSSLPAGLYQVIAHKPGFVPAIQILTRTTARVFHFLDFDLAQEELDQDPRREDFWSVRAKIPADVLREIQLAEAAALAARPPTPSFRAEMQAMTGVERWGQVSESWVTGGRLGVRGQVGTTELGFRGTYRQLQPASLSTSQSPAATGKTRALFLDLQPADSGQLSLSTLHNRLFLRPESNGLDSDRTPVVPIDLEHYGISWSQPVGDDGQSKFAAHYTTQNNFYSRSRHFEPLGLPEVSRSLGFEGSYRGRLSDTQRFHTGLSYEERLGTDAGLALLTPDRAALPQQRIDAFGLGDWQAQSSLMLKYGLFTTLRDGSLSVSPHGGVVLKLGSLWEARAALRQRFASQDEGRLEDFTATSYEGRGNDCGIAAEHCYKIQFMRRQGEDEALSIGATHREISHTLQLHFSDDFFNQLESLYLVEGDRLPELQLAVSHRLTPQILTRLESNLASGGGGTFHAVDESFYRNDVEYLVTSLDTRFQRTSSGLLLAFVRVEQELTPLDTADTRLGSQPQLELDRLQILFTQSLDLLLDLDSNWAVLLDLQLSRGSLPYNVLASSDDIRKRFIGGIVVKF